MGHRVRLAVVAFVFLVAVGTFAIVSAAVTPKTGASLEYDVQFNDTILTASQSGLSLGDRFILNDLLLRDGETVGHNGGVCTVNDVAGELICVVTWSLPNGTISTQFLNTAPPEKEFAITGGTGDYEGARGTGILIENGDETGSVAFKLMD